MMDAGSKGVTLRCMGDGLEQCLFKGSLSLRCHLLKCLMLGWKTESMNT